MLNILYFQKIFSRPKNGFITWMQSSNYTLLTNLVDEFNYSEFHPKRVLLYYSLIKMLINANDITPGY